MGGGLALGLGTAPLWGISDLPPAALSAAEIARLQSNENPYGPSPQARAAIQESAGLSNRYPTEAYKKLRGELAAANGLSPENILITPGSFNALCLTGAFFAGKGHSFLSCKPTFDWVLRQAERYGAPCRRLPLDENWYFALDELAAAARKKDVLYVCNPNNPTATTWPPARIRSFCENLLPNHYVFVDEAYIEYTTEGIKGSVCGLVNQYPNLIVSRTFSKLYGLAGSRVGYLMADPGLIRNWSN